MRRRNNKKKNLISFIIGIFALLGLGYAFLQSTLKINGTAKIMDATWDIHFKNLQIASGSVTLSSGDSAAAINPSDNTQITYVVTFSEPGQFYEFTVDAKNFGTVDGMIESVSSKLNGVEITSNSQLPVYLDYKVTYSDDIPIDDYHLLTAGSEVTYKVRLEYKRDIEISDLPSSFQTYSFSFGITSIQSDENAILKPEWPVIGDSTMTANTYRSSTYKNKIKTITLSDILNPPANPVESWDIGVAQNGDVMAYIIENSDDNTMYDLFIQGDGALFANPDSSNMFAELTKVDIINNMDVLDTSKTTNMQQMFYKTGYDSTVFTLDLGEKFNTSNVINMASMFSTTGYNSTVFTLDLGNKFDTSKVTNMSSMFNSTGYNSTVMTLDLGDKFDTSNVTNMYSMFDYIGCKSTVFTLNLGDNFDTSNATNMYWMFFGTGFNSQVMTLDLGNKFDTSKVTNMSSMFAHTGRSSPVFTLNLGNNFNTSNVTNMTSMFHQTGYSSTVFTLDLGDKFNTSKVMYMNCMFSKTGYSSTVFTLDLGSQFDTSKVTKMDEMFLSAGRSSTVFTLNLGSNFDTSNVTDMSYMFYFIGCSNSSFTLDLGSKFNTSNVTDMSYMFMGIGYLNNYFVLDLSTFDFSNVVEYDAMFGWYYNTSSGGTSSSYPFKTTQKIYVKNSADADWILTHIGSETGDLTLRYINKNLTRSNVLVKGA